MNKLSEGNQHPDGMHPADAGNMFDGTGQWMLGGEPQGFHALGQQILSLPSRIASAFQLSAAERADVSGRSDTLSKFGQRFYLRQAIGGAALAGMTAPMAAPVFADTLEHDQHIDVATLAGNLTTASIALSDAAAEISTAATTQEIEAIRVKAMPHLNALNAYPSTKMIAKMAQDALNAFATEAPRTFKGAEKIKLRAKSTAVDALVVAATMSGNLAKTLGSNIGSATESQAQEIATGKEATPPQKTDNPAKTVAQKAITARAEVKVWQELDTALFDHASALLNSKTSAELETVLRALEETTKTLKTYEQTTQIAKTIQKKIKLIKSLIAHKKGYEKSVTALAVQLMDAGKITNTLTAEKEQSATKSLQELGSLIAKQLAAQERNAGHEVSYTHKYTLEELQAQGLIDADTYKFGVEMRDGTWDTKPDRWIVPPENQQFGDAYVITDVKEGRSIIVNKAGRQKIFDAIAAGKPASLSPSEWLVLGDKSGATWIYLRKGIDMISVPVPQLAAANIAYATGGKIIGKGLGWGLDKAGVKIPNLLGWLADLFKKDPNEITTDEVLTVLREAKNTGEKWSQTTKYLPPTFANAYRAASSPAEEHALVSLYLAIAKEAPKPTEDAAQEEKDAAQTAETTRKLAIAQALNELNAATQGKQSDQLLLRAQYEALSQGVTSMQVIGEQSGKSLIAILSTTEENGELKRIARIVLAEGKVNETGVGNAQWYGVGIDNKLTDANGNYIVVGTNFTSKGSGGMSESETEITRSGTAKYLELHIAAGTELYKDTWLQLVGEIGGGVGYETVEGKDGKIILGRGAKLSFNAGKEANAALSNLGIGNAGIDFTVFRALDSSSFAKGNLVQARAEFLNAFNASIDPLHGAAISPSTSWRHEGIRAGIGWTHAIAEETAKLRRIDWSAPNAEHLQTIDSVVTALLKYVNEDDSTEWGRQLRGHGVRSWAKEDIQQFVADAVVLQALMKSGIADKTAINIAGNKAHTSLTRLENRNAQQRVNFTGYAHTFLGDKGSADVGGGYTFDYAYRAKNIAGTLDKDSKRSTEKPGPDAPTAVSGTDYVTLTSANSINVTVHGTPGAKIFVNGVDSGQVIGANGQGIVAVSTTGADGTKTASITTKLNGKTSAAVAISTLKDATAPAVNDVNPGSGNDNLTANSGAFQQMSGVFTEAQAAALTIDPTGLALKNLSTNALTGQFVDSIVSQTKVGNNITIVFKVVTTGVGVGQNLGIVTANGTAVQDAAGNAVASGTLIAESDTAVP